MKYALGPRSNFPSCTRLQALFFESLYFLSCTFMPSTPNLNASP